MKPPRTELLFTAACILLLAILANQYARKRRQEARQMQRDLREIERRMSADTGERIDIDEAFAELWSVES